MADSGKAVSKEISAALKAAKEAIRQKEFKEALKHCKNVIKIDKTNYHALVFIGVCAKELEQYEQSQAAYRKAIEQSPDQLLAWQGLCNLYEAAEREEWKSNLVEIYEKLIAVNKNDITKWRELLNKIISLQLSVGMVSEALIYLKDLEGTSPEPSEDLLCYWQKALSLLKEKLQKGDNSTELEDQLENAFQSTIEYNRILGRDLEQPFEQHVQFLCSFLKNVKNRERADTLEQQIEEKSQTLLNMSPANTNALQIICRILLERSDGLLPDATADYIRKLQNVDPECGLCKVGLACLAAQQKQWLQARDLLKAVEGLRSKEYIPVQWLLLARINLFFHDTASSIGYAEEGIRNLHKCATVSGREHFNKLFRIAKASCLIEQRKCQDAAEILKELLSSDPDNSEGLFKLGEAYALLNENASATEISEKLLKCQPNSHTALAIKAKVSMNEGQFFDAELRLQEAINLCDDEAGYHFLLGLISWELRVEDIEYAKKSHASFLKAAKLDPYNSEIFLHLGNYYKDFVLDLKKAQKCYQKAFALNEFNETAAMALGDISMDLGDENAALKVYQTATSNFGTGRVKLAWLRLGMLLTKQGKPEKAVACFQSALRADPKDRDCWECLGDAYIARGSYTAALKAFLRASEIDPSSVYCKYKIGSIKQTLCVYAEAVKEFTSLLSEKPDYIPALKGLAECHFRLELESLEMDFDGRSIDHASQVVKAAGKAFEIRPDLCCFWKIVGDACFALHSLHDEKIRLHIPTTISKVSGLSLGDQDANKLNVLDLSRRCFAAVVKLDRECASAWHDLAVSTFHFGIIIGGEDGKGAIQQSIQFAKRAISLAPRNHKMWNMLGLIAGNSDIANPELSQHAFIKALNLEPQSAEVWTNLGALYLKFNKVKAAHEAFKKAQDAEPSYTPAWIGQAMIAEQVGDADAMDLFRHSSELGSHTECFLGYAKWVCFFLQDLYKKKKIDTRANSEIIPETVKKAVVNSSVCAQKYTERMPKNPCAWNLLGILLEHENLFSQSEKAFERASELLGSADDVDRKNMVISNLARVLRSSGKFSKSIDAYHLLQPLNKVDDISGLALSYFLAGQLEKSLEAYEQALNLCENERDKSDVLAAMGMVGYAMDKVDMAKTLLFKSSQTAAPSEQGLMALASLGLLSRDHSLTNAALVEIEKHNEFNTEAVQSDFSFLISAMHLLQGNIIGAKRCVEKAVRRYPHSSRQWNNIAKFLYQRSPILSLETAGRCATISSELKPSSVSSMLISAASTGSRTFASKLTNHNSYTSSIRAAQKAVHSYPGQPEVWALLSTAAFAYNLRQGLDSLASLAISTSRLALQKAEERLADLQDALKTTIPRQLTPRILVAVNLRVWTIKQLICCYIKEGTYDIALLLCENAMTQYEENVEVQQELFFLKIVAQVLQQSSCGGDVDALLQTAKEVCDADEEDIWKRQILAGLYLKLGLPLVAELFVRQCVQLSSQEDIDVTSSSSLSRLALMSIQCYSKDSSDRWIALAKEAISEASKLNCNNHVIDILRLSLHHVQGESKKAKKIISGINFNEDSFTTELIDIWKKLYPKEEQEEITDKDLYEVQNWN